MSTSRLTWSQTYFNSPYDDDDDDDDDDTYNHQLQTRTHDNVCMDDQHMYILHGYCMLIKHTGK